MAKSDITIQRPDYDSGLADVYISQVRQIEKHGGKVRSRPAVNREEKQIAQEVRRRVDRQTFGYSPQAEAPVSDVCERCSATEGLRLKGRVYLDSGQVINRYRCEDHR